MVNLPSGTVTFLFTDIEGSTKLAQQFPDQWEALRQRHHVILQEAIDSNNGFVFQIIGDAFCVAFHTALDALNTAVKAQQLLQQEVWSPASIKVRMGINTGTAQIGRLDDHSGGYKGYTAMARVQRVMSVGYGGQILMSNSSFELVQGELPSHINLRDMGEHRLKGLLNPEHLWQVIVPGLVQDFPALQSLNKIPNNLPVQLTSFVGREKEVEEIKQKLAQHRLIALTGIGGTGKTRLSLQVAAEVLDQYPDGIWFIELAPLADPNLIPQSILAVLHYGEQAGKTPLQVLEEQLNNKKLLLLLDNCEHLIEASARVAHSLLMSAPEIKILATSREALGVRGELAWQVPSLALPDSKSLLGIEQLTQYESVRLFIERALLIQPHFEVDQNNAPAIAQICHRLDGIPLAIELAAARLKMLSVDQIAARLNDRFRLLTSGSRTVLPRQQTLRATIDWSYDLLDENEKRLFRCLAVFEGGWSLELAEQICGDDRLNSWDILDTLSHLVDKSLVAVAEGKTGARYHILETVRHYAREKLFETEEVNTIRDKHRDVYLAFAEKIEPETIRAERKKWLNVYETELANFRAAFHWSLENKDVEQAIRLCTGLANFRGQNNHQTEAAVTSKQALDLMNEMGTVIPEFWQAGILLVYVVFNRGIQGKSFSDPSFLPLLEKSHELYKSVNNYAHSAPVIAATFLAIGYMDLNDLASAEKCFLDVLKRVKATNYLWGVAWSKLHMARLASRKGDVADRLSLLEEALELFREVGDSWSAENISGILMQEKYLRGEFEEAIKNLNQNILFYENDDREGPERIALCYEILGSIALLQGQYEAARRYVSDAANIYGNLDLGFRTESVLMKENLAFLLYEEGKLDAAQDEYETLIAQYKDLSDTFSYGVIRARYALVCLSKGTLREARQSLERAFDILSKLASQEDFSIVQFDIVYFGFGELARVEGNAPEAIENYYACLRHVHNKLSYKSFPEILDAIAKTECLRSDFEKAAHLMGGSEAIRKKMKAVIHPVDRADYDKHINLLESNLGTEKFEVAWLEGGRMSVEGVYAYALKGPEE